MVDNARRNALKMVLATILVIAPLLAHVVIGLFLKWMRSTAELPDEIYRGSDLRDWRDALFPLAYAALGTSFMFMYGAHLRQQALREERGEEKVSAEEKVSG